MRTYCEIYSHYHDANFLPKRVKIRFSSPSHGTVFKYTTRRSWNWYLIYIQTHFVTTTRVVYYNNNSSSRYTYKINTITLSRATSLFVYVPSPESRIWNRFLHLPILQIFFYFYFSPTSTSLYVGVHTIETPSGTSGEGPNDFSRNTVPFNRGDLCARDERRTVGEKIFPRTKAEISSTETWSVGTKRRAIFLIFFFFLLAESIRLLVFRAISRPTRQTSIVAEYSLFDRSNRRRVGVPH